ncbi:MAG: RNA polymerase sigma factor [Candidatus Magasanikbacteria bacterium]|nr:RNA polymerase sigma factor [Candidatus Magasanikbacteria bacterium]
MAEKKVFEKFYNTHFDKVYRFVFFRSGGNKELAEDLVSEIFMKALDHFDGYDENVSKSAWIMTISKNHLANHWRDTKKTSPLPEDDVGDESYTTDAFWLKSGLSVGRKQANNAEVYELLAQLEETEAEIVTLHYIIGYNYLEIGAMKNMSEGAIKVAAHRAIKKLRTLL